MTTVEHEIQMTEADRVLAWRIEALERAGYSEHAAVELALRVDVDLSSARHLRELGCPDDVALRILL